MSFKDKVVIVTGAGVGIGAATAKLFGEKGATVVVSDINEEKATEVCNFIVENGGKAKVIKTNVTSFSEVENLIQQTIADFEKLDIIVNNAGIANKNLVRTAESTLNDWENVIAVNQTGVYYCMKVALQQMQKQEFGNIVNVASLAGLKASSNNISYTASKFAVVGMTKAAALEYARKNIRINAVCPGYTHTDLFNKLLEVPGMSEKLLKFVPMKRFGEATEIAEAISWLASDQTKFITGQTITIDGGTSV